MALMTLVAIFVVSVLLYVTYNSYWFQLQWHKRKLKSSFLEEFRKEVKGTYNSKAYFAVSHKVVRQEEFNSFSNSHKQQFSPCYNVITFRTPDAYWELFFHLVKEGVQFSEIMTLRVFPKHIRIRSEGNVEKNYSRLNIFTNNRYLTEVLESSHVREHLNWLIRHNDDILLISHNGLHFKAFIRSTKMSSKRVLDMVKAMNYIKNKIYKKDVLEY